MKNFMEGMFVAQEGEDKEKIKSANARIKAANEEIGIVEIDPEMLERLDSMELEELEALAEVIAEKISERKGESN